jgi:hypothetical protein
LETPRDTKVAKYNMAIRVNENVLWLKISVNDVMVMNVFDGKKLNNRVRGTYKWLRTTWTYKFRHVETYCFYVEYLRYLQLLQITPRKILLSQWLVQKIGVRNQCAYRYEIEVLCVVEARMKGNDKVVPIQLRENSLLIDGRAECNFSATSSVFVDGLESIQAGRMPLPHEVNDRICSRTQSAQDLVVIEAWGDIGTLSRGISSLKIKRWPSKKGRSSSN